MKNINKLNLLDKGIDTSNYIINKFKHILDIFNNSKENKYKLLTEDLFLDVEDLSYFFNTFENIFDSEELNAFQEFYLKSLIDIINNKINHDNIHFNINTNQKIYFLDVIFTEHNKEYNLLTLDPYLKTIKEKEYQYILNINNCISEKKIELNKLKEYELYLYSISQSPQMLSNDNILKMVDIRLRTKKYLNEIQKEMVANSNNINRLAEEIITYKVLLEEEYKNITNIDVLKTNFLDKLIVFFNFKKLV
ncbi:TPA: hypothetical protein UL242_002502 [Clostridioides difficile]|uniref:hypothetical protein n=1 Tax=Clostridioides difficile TaxID=1496 RepID=UPI000BB16F53|nr:hypothetical protein [Clostridioides difficile]EGT3644234.1 hypothetical protein [Clostridioides difficile]MBH7847210.1 hypothetical protein [Clostridioides difficile]MBY1346147.1 hypothetical protein [Clostridioides difficile]MBY1662640.1 hypothetical protein [Clostridioides difficile]MCW0772820.1 hypothetical protein [Clostridioides difficile]